MKEKYVIQKRWGETPLEALERLRKEETIPDAVPMTYAGRLDPAAEGLLVILTGEECKNKDVYSKLDKTYVAEFLFGVGTDTYDLLGVPAPRASSAIFLPAELPSEYASVKQSSAAQIALLARGTIGAYLNSKIGIHTQKYPPYSSKTVDGKQLHEHARAGSAVALPAHEVTLYSYSDLSIRTISKQEVLDRVETLVQKVRGDFRQAEILSAWKGIQNVLPEHMTIVSAELRVGSGFYIRQLAEDMGSCLYSLNRTKIG